MTESGNGRFIALNINRCPNEFCTRLYPSDEKITYRFHKTAHNSRTRKAKHFIFSGNNDCIYTFSILEKKIITALFKVKSNPFNLKMKVFSNIRSGITFIKGFSFR